MGTKPKWSINTHNASQNNIDVTTLANFGQSNIVVQQKPITCKTAYIISFINS